VPKKATAKKVATTKVKVVDGQLALLELADYAFELLGSQADCSLDEGKLRKKSRPAQGYTPEEQEEWGRSYAAQLASLKKACPPAYLPITGYDADGLPTGICPHFPGSISRAKWGAGWFGPKIEGLCEIGRRGQLARLAARPGSIAATGELLDPVEADDDLDLTGDGTEDIATFVREKKVAA
jgi:hypothetical protein